MRQPYKAAIIGGGLQKALTLGDLDDFMDWAVSGGDGSGAQDLYKAVAWTFWCTNLRADSVAKTPYLIFPMELPEDKESPDEAVEFGIDLRPMLWYVEAWLVLKAAAYVLQHFSGTTLEELQILNSNTVKVKTWDDRGNALTFEQRYRNELRTFSADEILYFRTFDPSDDIHEGVSSGQVATDAGALIRNANRWARDFFLNGAIPSVILTTEGQVGINERKRIEGWWNKQLQGLRQFFKTIVMQNGLKPVVVGQPVKDLAMPELEETRRQQILAAHKIPAGLAEPTTNRAEQDALRVRLWTDCIIPEIEIWIEPVLNKQLFNRLGLRISFQYSGIEALQREELEKAEAMAFAITGVILPAFKENTVMVDDVRAWINSVGGAAGLPALKEPFVPEERTPPQLQPFTGEQDAGDNGGGEDDAEIDIEERIESRLPKSLLDDLGRWERKALTRIKEGFPSKALEFTSDAIPAVMHRMIVHSLAHAATLGDVVEVFKSARGESKQVRFVPEGQGDPLPPVPNEVTVSDADVDRAIRDWNRHMPDFVGLLDAEVIHRENYDA
jgi:hypothetical protein